MPNGGSERILVVDDEPPILKITQHILGALGYQVTTMGDSQEALARFQDDPDAFDLILTDLTMPKMAGDQMAEAMLSIRPDIPIILTTGYSHKLDEKKVTAMGIRSLVIKPVSRQTVATEVRRLLDMKATDPEINNPR